jgi:hypothetical protein
MNYELTCSLQLEIHNSYLKYVNNIRQIHTKKIFIDFLGNVAFVCAYRNCNRRIGENK